MRSIVFLVLAKSGGGAGIHTPTQQLTMLYNIGEKSCYYLLFGFVRSPPMSSAFQISSGTTLAHCGTADTGRENPDIACLIACTWAAVGQKTVNDHNREEMVCALYVNTFALKCVEVFQPGSQALSPFKRDPGSKAGSDPKRKRVHLTLLQL